MTSEISPDLFLDRLLGFQETAALKAAVRLGLFDALEAGAAAAPAIAARIGAAPKGARVLADFLTLKGFLTKQDGLYDLTPSSRVFLTTRSPACIAGVVEFLAGEHQYAPYMDHPEEMVRHGGATELRALAPEHPMWVSFAKAMGSFVAPTADAVAAEVAGWSSPLPGRVLDVAAGHGRFGLAFAQAFAQARVTALDWAPVLEVARANAAAAGLADRFETIAGDALAVEWGLGYDLVLLPNFLHHFSAATGAQILAKARAALAPGGKALVVEFVPDEERLSPPFPSRFAYVMLGSTAEGDAYTVADYDAMRAACGFAVMTIKPLPPSPQTLLVFSD